VWNAGGGALNYTISDSVAWLSCSPTTGSCSGATRNTITVTYAATSLSAGTYNGTITISDPAAANSPQTIPVTLTVTAAGTTTSPSGATDIPQVSPPATTEFITPPAELAHIFKPIYFDFDRYDIKPEAAVILRGVADYLLKTDTKRLVMIEGHCDERGTREYNLILGEQRALSARRYLVQLGVSPNRIFTISYGEDVPADPGHNEAAWAKNRRCEFKISKD